MLLEPQDAVLFFKLHRALMVFVNQRLRLVPQEVAAPEAGAKLPAELWIQVRDALLDQPELLESFGEQNPAGLSQSELGIVQSWRHFVRGRFYIFREMKKYTVFLSCTKPPVAYGVVALAQPLEELVGPYLPVMTDAVLLPFKGRIVYDSFLSTFGISFGGGIRRLFNESYKAAKAQYGIVTALPM